MRTRIGSSTRLCFARALFWIFPKAREFRLKIQMQFISNLYPLRLNVMRPSPSNICQKCEKMNKIASVIHWFIDDTHEITKLESYLKIGKLFLVFAKLMHQDTSTQWYQQTWQVAFIIDKILNCANFTFSNFRHFIEELWERMNGFNITWYFSYFSHLYFINHCAAQINEIAYLSESVWS